jgi:hypothetical protein
VLNASNAKRSRSRTVKPIEINNGFVIFKGRYIKPPYIIKSQRGRIYINKFEVPYLPQASFFRRNIGMRYFDRTLLNQTLEQIEHNLQRDAMLICTHSGLLVYSPAQQVIPILDVLLSEQTQDEKVQMLIEIGPSWIPSDQWALMVETFKAPSELSERVLALKKQRVELDKSDIDDELSMSFLSGITIAGFILTVWAFGTLLSCRPPAITGERTVDSAKGYYRQAIWGLVQSWVTVVLYLSNGD